MDNEEKENIIRLIEERYSRVLERMLEKDTWTALSEERYDRMIANLERVKKLWNID